MRNSIRTRLTVAFIGLAVCPLLLVGAVLAWQSFATQQQQALNWQREMARRVAAEVFLSINLRAAEAIGLDVSDEILQQDDTIVYQDGNHEREV